MISILRRRSDGAMLWSLVSHTDQRVLCNVRELVSIIAVESECSLSRVPTKSDANLCIAGIESPRWQATYCLLGVGKCEF